MTRLRNNVGAIFDSEGEAFAGEGGAIRGSAIAEDCLFESNLAGFGGAVEGSTTMVGCRFVGNQARVGAAVVGGSGMSIDECRFESNHAEERAAVVSESGAVTIGNSYFCGNTPDDIDGFYTDTGGNTFEAECPECPADIDGSGDVGFSDLVAILAA